MVCGVRKLECGSWFCSCHGSKPPLSYLNHEGYDSAWPGRRKRLVNRAGEGTSRTRQRRGSQWPSAGFDMEAPAHACHVSPRRSPLAGWLAAPAPGEGDCEPGRPLWFQKGFLKAWVQGMFPAILPSECRAGAECLGAEAIHPDSVFSGKKPGRDLGGESPFSLLDKKKLLEVVEAPSGRLGAGIRGARLGAV